MLRELLKKMKAQADAVRWLLRLSRQLQGAQLRRFCVPRTIPQQQLM